MVCIRATALAWFRTECGEALPLSLSALPRLTALPRLRIELGTKRKAFLEMLGE